MCRCQKQPLTKTAHRRERFARSGEPGRSRLFKRYATPRDVNSFRTICSGVVPFWRMRPRRAEVSSSTIRPSRFFRSRCLGLDDGGRLRGTSLVPVQVPAHGIQEAVGEIQRAFLGAGQEASRGFLRKARRRVSKERRQSSSRVSLGPRRYVRRAPRLAELPGCAWPPAAGLESDRIPAVVVVPWLCQAVSDPLRHRSVDRVADEFPARSGSRHSFCGLRVIDGKPLQTFCISDIQCMQASIGKENCGW